MTYTQVCQSLKISLGVNESSSEYSLGESDSKLMLYGKVKRQCSYETYLDSDCHDLRSLIKFRMSIHGFPIKRGIYNYYISQIVTKNPAMANLP